MSKRAPLQKEADFLLCDDFRSETNNKVTIVGLFPSRRINIHTPSLPADIRLTFVVLFRDGEGEFAVRFSVEDPEGNKIRDGQMPQKTVLHEGGGGVVVNFGALPLNSVGKYRFRLHLDDSEYAWGFHVVHAPPKD
jgi:hypothetical protein